MTRFACTPAETSCLLSNLFTELRPVCGRCGGDAVVLCGLTYEGEEQVVVLRDYGFDYSGRRETVERIRKVTIISNPNLGSTTKVQEILEGHQNVLNMIQEFLPVRYLCVREDLCEEIRKKTDTLVLPLKLRMQYEGI